MEKSLFEQVGSTYTQVGDYLLPNLTLTEEAQKSIGIWGQQHARYLKQYHETVENNGAIQFQKQRLPNNFCRESFVIGQRLYLIFISSSPLVSSAEGQ